MNRYIVLSICLAFSLYACQQESSNQSTEESVEKSMEEEEEERERGEPTRSNIGKPQPVPASYVNAAQCDSFTHAPTYTFHVKPIVNTRCAVPDCHNSITKAGDLDMEGYANTRRTFEHLKGFCSIMHDHEANCRHMPTSRIQLPQRDINRILCWAKNGYVE